MITEVRIKDNRNTPISYLHKIDTFKNGTEYHFKPGINIVIGKNGCGKTTLINLLSKYTLCSDYMYSKLPSMTNIGDTLSIADLFGGEFTFEKIGKDTDVKDGASVVCDYAGIVYHYILKDSIDSVASMENLSFLVGNSGLSTGEQMSYSLNSLFDTAFSKKDVNFPINEIKNLMKRSNDLWKGRFESLLKYYHDNRLNITEKDFEFTFLLDEPDRNLDIAKIDELYNVLSYRKELTQIICVIHNPVLIYKLSKLDYINFIEMTDGYLNEIKTVFEDL